MMKVFIGGSRGVSSLNAEVRQRLDTILGEGFPIVIGDANGADKVVQRYLFHKHYMNVEVYCSDGGCRNNLGGWAVRSVPVRSRKKTADFYSAKDRVMAEEATVGLMIWNGQSVGTLMNVFRLLNFNKKAVIYSVRHKEFIEFHDAAEWENFIDRCDCGLRRKVQERLAVEVAAQGTTPRVSGDMGAYATVRNLELDPQQHRGQRVRMTPKDYEKAVLQRFRTLWPPPRFVVKHGIRLSGHKTKARRQVDVSIFETGKSQPFLIVEAKRHKRPIDVGIAGSTIALVQDVGRVPTVMISTSGFSRAASNHLGTEGIAHFTITLKEAQGLHWIPMVEEKFAVDREFREVSGNLVEALRNGDAAPFLDNGLPYEEWLQRSTPVCRSFLNSPGVS